MKHNRFKYHKLSWLKMPFWLCTSGNIFFKETYSQYNNPSLNLILKLFAFVEVICSTQGGVFSTQLTNRMPAWLGFSRNFMNLLIYFISHLRGSILIGGLRCHYLSKLKLLKRTFSDKTMKWIWFFFHRVQRLNVLCSHWLFLLKGLIHDQTITGRRNFDDC